MSTPKEFPVPAMHLEAVFVNDQIRCVVALPSYASRREAFVVARLSGLVSKDEVATIRTSFSVDRKVSG